MTTSIHPHAIPLDTIVHERTLLGAIDSYLGGLVHVRPHLAGNYREQLETMAEAALEAGFPNAVEAPEASWLEGFVAVSAEPKEARAAIADFYSWAESQGFVSSAPLERGANTST
jgi:hypothetical protein